VQTMQKSGYCIKELCDMHNDVVMVYENAIGVYTHSIFFNFFLFLSTSDWSSVMVDI